MTKERMYRYLGRNGIITTVVKLENIDPILMTRLQAAEGKLLTNGVDKVAAITVFDDEIDNWIEIEDDRTDKINL